MSPPRNLLSWIAWRRRSAAVFLQWYMWTVKNLTHQRTTSIMSDNPYWQSTSSDLTYDLVMFCLWFNFFFLCSKYTVQQCMIIRFAQTDFFSMYKYKLQKNLPGKNQAVIYVNKNYQNLLFWNVIKQDSWNRIHEVGHTLSEKHISELKAFQSYVASAVGPTAL